MLSHPLFLALCAVWFASELWIDRRRSIAAAARHDAGTLRLLHAMVAVGLAGGVALAWFGPGRFAPSLAWLPWTGLALMVSGLLLRAWSVRVLAKQFTVDVSVRPDHELVRRGPYRLLRHPSYTGALLTFLGFALALGSWASLPAVMLPVAFAFGRRIRVEERVLCEAFPEAYPAYARTTWRLLPYVW